jgi:hypothetical protein
MAANTKKYGDLFSYSLAVLDRIMIMILLGLEGSFSIHELKLDYAMLCKIYANISKE